METRETTHFFLALPKFQERLEAWVAAAGEHWRPAVLGFTNGWLKEGCGPARLPGTRTGVCRFRSRGSTTSAFTSGSTPSSAIWPLSIEWAERQGTPDAWKAWWELDENGTAPGRSYYFVGKDNIPFHAIIWPAMLMGYGGLALPYDVPANEFLTIDCQKLSSSRTYTSRLPFLPEALDLLGADAIRFFLTINAPESRDTDFSWDEFQRRNNDELVATYGNAVHRLLSFTQSRFGGVVPTPGELTPADEAMLALTAEAFNAAARNIEAVHLRDGLRDVMALAGALNRYLDEAAPWKTLKIDPERAATSLWTALQVVSSLRVLCCAIPAVLGRAAPCLPW